MSEAHKREEKLGAVLFQVQEDLRKLRCSLEKITDKDKTLDVEAFDSAIRETESKIKRHAEDYLNTVTKQPLVLPAIEDLPRRTVHIPKWKPALEKPAREGVLTVHPKREDLPGPSHGEKLKSTLAMRSLCNSTHPHNRAVQQKFQISLPDVHERSKKASQRTMAGPVVSRQVTEPKSRKNLGVLEEDMRRVSETSLLCTSIKHKAASLHPREDSSSPKMGLLGSKPRRDKQLKLESEPGLTSETTGREYTSPWTAKTPPPSTNSKNLDHMGMIQGTDDFIPKNPQNTVLDLPVQVPAYISKYSFTIIKGQINPMATDFCLFKESFSLCWSTVLDALEALQKLLRDFAVPLAKVSGEHLVELAYSWDNSWRNAPPVTNLLSVLENWEGVVGLVVRPGQRFKGEGGTEAAATHIQSCWRRYLARTAYLHHCRRKWAAETIAMSWWMHNQMCYVRKALQARRFRQLENHRSRAQHLAANWKHIQSSKRTIIHIPSLGLSQSQRQKLREFNILQNTQLCRLCDIRDENVEVIYVCPRHLGEDILQYYTSVLRCERVADGADTRTAQAPSCSSRRFVILTPEAVDYFPTHNMCLSTLLKYSPHTLKRIWNLIQGKQAYIVGGVAHVDDLAVADELGVPVLASEPAIAQLYSTKSGGRRIFAGAELDVPPGQGDIYSLNQLHETLAELMTQNIDVKRWLFKMDSEYGGRGTAYCDTCHLSCYNWALREYHRYDPEKWKTAWNQESVLLRYLDEIPEWLARYARPAKTSCYPTWASFLKTFLRQGGVVEAYPPSESVTCLTVDLLLEPGGEVTMLSCGDQLHGSCQLESLGSTVPQTSVHPDTLNSICVRVGQACLQRHIVGYISLDLATFVNPNTMEQKVWAIDLDLAYSNQLAMTQMLLMMTGGTLNCCTGCLEVPLPIREACCGHRTAAKPPVMNRHAVIGSSLFHSNLSMLYHHVFLKICKVHGVGFNMKMKQGTVFALYDSIERCNMGMMTVSEDLQGALVTFAQNLSVIHQEISASKMQGETNFKELIKEIEEVLHMTGKNKMRAVEDKTAA
ncbi:IQ motif-containing protein H isoform X2 [Notolabrus celidotus]|uniref:IQ motif-containing protein H isoform X2 n=1 Tax=Notolabrus celidotus TaxID=1203425 RepID=UPI00148F608E|nr:IQ motif-containing protein H isoform X2 [Notolabrus celidotus]